MINPYSSDIYYYYGKINYRVSRYNVYVKDLRSSLYYRNKNNKFYLKSSSSDIMEIRIQPNITWRENILCIRVFLSDDPSEIQAQIEVIIVIIVFNSEDDNNDDNKGRKKAAEIAKVNIARVTRQNKKRNT